MSVLKKIAPNDFLKGFFFGIGVVFSVMVLALAVF